MSCSGEHDDYFEYTIFATKDKEYAEKYIEKLWNLIQKTKKMLEPYTEKFLGYSYIKSEYYDSWQYNRWEQTHNLDKPFIRETELR